MRSTFCKKMENPFDDNQCYTLNLWIVSSKSVDEFEVSLKSVIHPITIENHHFELGDVHGDIRWNLETQPPKFPNVPAPIYSYRIDIDVVDFDLWSRIDRVFTFALAQGLRGKFSSEYLITADMKFFALYSGTNKPNIVNILYPPISSGEVFTVDRTSNKIIEVSIPSNQEAEQVGDDDAEEAV